MNVKAQTGTTLATQFHDLSALLQEPACRALGRTVVPVDDAARSIAGTG